MEDFFNLIGRIFAAVGVVFAFIFVFCILGTWAYFKRAFRFQASRVKESDDNERQGKNKRASTSS